MEFMFYSDTLSNTCWVRDLDQYDAEANGPYFHSVLPDYSILSDPLLYQ